ncbi:MAG: c-type cytochrome [Candidatus Sulfotelmatobacter sp.]
MLLSLTGNALCQNPKGEDSAPKPDLRGKNIFELRCATCHGLDGMGAEHAPDIVRQPAVSSLSDQDLLHLIHDGIPEGGMPAFSDMEREDGLAVVGYLRFLQGKSTVGSVAGNPGRGRDLFFGKAGCSVCHQIVRQGQFVPGDLRGFAMDHDAGEIRDAVLTPAGGEPEAATALARDGRTFSGVIRNEDNDSLQLQGEDGTFYLLMKSSLVSVQRKAGTPMPVDYGHRLSGAEIDDLVAYILHEAGSSGASSSSSGKDLESHAQQ